METFRIRCEQARVRGALGTFYVIDEHVEARNDIVAEGKFRLKYETRSPLAVTHLPVTRRNGRRVV
jgi:hypothetical protein